MFFLAAVWGLNNTAQNTFDGFPTHYYVIICDLLTNINILTVVNKKALHLF